MADVQGDNEAALEDDAFPDDGPLDTEEGGGGEPISGGDEEEEEDVDGLASFLESEILSGSSDEDPIDVSALCLFSPFEPNLFSWLGIGFLTAIELVAAAGEAAAEGGR